MAKADKIYEVLVKLAGAPDRPIDRWQFASHLAEVEEKKRQRTLPGGAGDEYRFGGALGAGGKVWYGTSRGWRVNCYREDETPTRLAVIETTNAALEQFNTAAQRAEARR
jgi:hypothetical protein